MKKLRTILVLVLLIFVGGNCVMAQEKSQKQAVKSEQTESAKAEEVEKPFFTRNEAGQIMVGDRLFYRKDESGQIFIAEELLTLKDLLYALLYLGIFFGYIFAILHMIKVFLFNRKRYRKVFIVDDFVRVRSEQGRPADSSDEEDQQAWGYLNSFVDGWEYAPNYDPANPTFIPTKSRHIRSAVNVLDAAIALAPTDPEIVDEINSCAEVININEKRLFSGSKSFMWIALIFAVITIFWSKAIGFFWFMIVGIIMYWLSSRRPRYLVAKEQRSGKNGCLNAAIIGVFTMVLEARTVTTTTKYTDGSTSSSDDYSEHWISWILSLGVMAVLSTLIYVWAIINYFRNYVFHR